MPWNNTIRENARRTAALRKFIVLNGKAYTEEKFLIYTVRVELYQTFLNGSKKTMLEHWFHHYELKSIENCSKEVCLITFKKAEDAYEVLCDDRFLTQVLTSASDLKFTAAYSWEQPGSKPLIRKLFAIHVGPTDPEESPIFKLSDDCLMHVNEYLSVIDQFHFSRLSSRFETAFASEFKRKHKCLVISEEFDSKLLQIREIFMGYGHLVETIKVRLCRINDIVKEFVSEYCPNLKSIDMNKSGQCTPLFFEKIQHFQNIHTVKMSQCALEDRELEYLSRISSIQTLDVSYNYSLNCLSLPSFANLNELNIEGLQCRVVEQQTLISRCKNLTKLTVLNIKNCPILLDATILQNLLELTISDWCVRSLESIPQLPNLEKLYLHIEKTAADNLFTELAYKPQTKLRVLTISLGRFQNLTETQKNCICRLTALEEFSLSSHHIGDEFLQRMSSLPNLKSFDACKCPLLTVGAMLDFMRDAPKLQKLVLPVNWTPSDYGEFFFLASGVLHQRRIRFGEAPFFLFVKSSTYSSLTEDCKEYLRSPRNIIKLRKLP